MDLRQFTTTPNNFDNGQDQRRTSISSMSSASGYASSAYGGATPNNSRIGAQSRYFGQPQNQQQPPSSNGSGPNWLQQSSLNVTPWIEQQQQVSNSNNSIENQNFVNSYGNNLNSTYLLQQQQQQHHHQHAQQQQIPLPSQTPNQSIQATYDSQSTRASPSISNAQTTTQHQIDGAELKSDDVKRNDNDSNDNDIQDDNNDELNDNDDELIPTAIVIKNIPFAIKKEQLLEVMTKLNLPLPYAFNYHFDNGVFRGLAFANFTSTNETTAVVTQLNGREIGGRKLRVEYKKMLPLVERERIEREKREKRGQLEEQHRSTSNASLASLISVASAPAGITKLPNSNNLNQAAPQNLVISSTPSNSNQTSERFYAPIPYVNNLPIPPQQVDFNDPETLEYYSQLLFFRDDRDRLYNEVAYPTSLSQNHKRIISILTGFLGLIETYDNNLILIKRRSLIHDPSPLLRSQSHSAIPLLSSQANNVNIPLQNQNQGQAQGQLQPQPQQPQPQPQQQQSQHQSQRFRTQTTIPPQSPAHQHTTNSRIPPNFSLGPNNSLSSAALLRNNPTPTRIVPNLYNQSQSSGFLNQSTSQPPTPSLDSFSRFNLNQNPSSQPQSQSQSQPQPQPQPQQQNVQTPTYQNFPQNHLNQQFPQFVQSQQQVQQQHNYQQPPPQQQPQHSGGQWDEPNYNGSSGGSSNDNDLNDNLNALNLGLDNNSSIWGSRNA